MAEVLQFEAKRPRKKRLYPEFLFTSEACVINSCEQVGIPILIDEYNQIVWPVVHYFTYLRVYEDRPENSLKTYSDNLRIFWEFLSSEGVDWKDVDDDVLTIFRNRQREGIKVSHGQTGKPVKEVTINGRLNAIFGFYWWCFLNGFVKPSVIGPPTWDKDGHHRPQIVVEVEGHDPRSDQPYKNLSFKSHLMYKNPPKPKRDVPTDEQVSMMHASLGKVRDTCLAQWTELTSLRVHELGRLKLSHIPSYDDIEELRETESFHRFLLKGKGGKERWIYTLADLLETTRDYIEIERAEIVAKKKAGDKSYREPEEVFLSETYGLPIKKDTISKYIRTAFKETGFGNRLHDLRAKYASDTIRSEIENAIADGYTLDSLIADGFGTVLVKAAERMGHNRVEYLRPYVELEKKRIFGGSKVAVAAKVEENIRGSERRLGVLLKQITDAVQLREVAQKLTNGDKDGAVESLERLLEELKKDG